MTLEMTLHRLAMIRARPLTAPNRHQTVTILELVDKLEICKKSEKNLLKIINGGTWTIFQKIVKFSNFEKNGHLVWYEK